MSDRRYTPTPCDCGDAFCAGCDDADEAFPRLTTVHHRYHVDGDWPTQHPDLGCENIDVAMTKAEAIRIADRRVGPRGFERVRVFDLMAPRGMRQVYEANAKAGAR